MERMQVRSHTEVRTGRRPVGRKGGYIKEVRASMRGSEKEKGGVRG